MKITHWAFFILFSETTIRDRGAEAMVLVLSRAQEPPWGDEEDGAVAVVGCWISLTLEKTRLLGGLLLLLDRSGPVDHIHMARRSRRPRLPDNSLPCSTLPASPPPSFYL